MILNDNMLKLKKKGDLGNKLLVCIVNKMKKEAIYNGHKFNVKKINAAHMSSHEQRVDWESVSSVEG